MFSVKGAVLKEGLRNISKTLKDVEFYNIRVSKDKTILITAKTESSKMSVSVLAETVERSCEFAVNFENLTKTISNRIEIEFKLEDNNLKFKTKSYRGHLAIMPYEEIEVMNEGIKKQQFSLEQKQEILSTMNLISLERVLEQDNITLFLKQKDGVLTGASSSNWHAAWVDKKITDGKDFKLQFPVDYVQYFKLFFEKPEEVNIASDKNQIYLFNSTMQLSLPQVQIDDLFDSIKQMIKIEKEPKFLASIAVSGLSSIIENLTAVYETNATVKLSCKDNNIRFSISTKYGSASDLIAAKILKGSNLSVNLEMNTLKDVVNRISDKVRIIIADEKEEDEIKSVRIEQKLKNGKALFFLAAVRES
jgi:hypothetical protein